MSQFRDNSWLATARSYGVLKSLRSSARFAKSKSKSAVNLNALSKQEQKKQKLQQQSEQQQQEHQQLQQQQQQQQQEEAVYANVEEIYQQTEIEEDALMGNAQVSDVAQHLKVASIPCSISMHRNPINQTSNQ
ncbi:hypothetical protein ACLKA6_008213 [Drosophila palustris]